MAQALEFAAPVMGRAAGLQEHVGRRARGEEPPEARARQPVPFVDAAGRMRDRHLEDRLCQVDADLRSVHVDSSSVPGLSGP